MPDVGQRAPEKCGQTKILQKSPMTVIEKYLYHCWWGMKWTFFLLLLTFLSSALSKQIFSPYSTAERAFHEKSVFTLKLLSSTFLGCGVICIYKDQ
jgi:hypothetical protein